MATASSPINTSSSPLSLGVSINPSNQVKIGYGKAKIISTAKGNTLKQLKTIFSNTVNTFGSISKNDDEIYDTSVLNLIKWSEQQQKSFKLVPADFAYLKDLGVYPNNRLIIARRFSKPVGNDLSSLQGVNPLATLISWAKNDENLLSISVGEKWIEADGSFESIFNNIGTDLTLSKDNADGMSKLGGFLGGGGGTLPLPGLTEGFQSLFFQALGLQDKNNEYLIRQGDPSLIKEAKRRKTIAKGDEGSGLSCDISIKMTVEYEQKYINGVDPTDAYYNIISNILSFATSNAKFVWSTKFATDSNNILSQIINGDVQTLKKNFEEIISKLTVTIKDFADAAAKAIKDLASGNTGSISELFKRTVGAIFQKYRIALMGVINALTGMPSTPWHVTIGNPKKPIFSSGDMYVDTVNVELGPVLSYNDLPSSIKAEFTLKNARSLGADEVFDRFLPSGSRTYSRAYDIYEDPKNSGSEPIDTTEEKTLNGPTPLAPANTAPNSIGYYYNPANYK